MLALSQASVLAYDAMLQEDRFVEWWTASLFAAAGVVRVVGALRDRRVFDLLVALFCLFVAGEEISWGQRLLGYTPPDYFLAHNTQQEFTLHNFADLFGTPKHVLTLALAGYGIGLPVAERTGLLRALLRRTGATAPASSLAIWFVAGCGLLIWYPVDFTGEWVEALSGALFLMSSPGLKARDSGILTVAAAGVALLAAVAGSQSVRARPALLACARAETRALLQDAETSLAVYDGLLHRRVHKRVQSAVDDAYLAPELRQFHSVACRGEAGPQAAGRHRFAIDPWGLAYWVRSEPGRAGTIITIYSFGPNRRRDNEPGLGTGDDVIAVGRVPRW